MINNDRMATDALTPRDKLKYDITRSLSLIKLPTEVGIATMTVICDMDINFNAVNIARYVDITNGRIVKVSHGRYGDPLTNRSIIPQKRTKKSKKQKKIFYNQVSVCVNVASKLKKPINVKLFYNGSIQMTGCKTIENAIDALEQIFIELKKVKAIIDYKTMKIVEKPFVSSLDAVDLRNVRNIRVEMINSGFKVPFKIDREKLYHKLLADGFTCTYDPVVHACVNVKYNHPDKVISIFVFEKGSVLITGAKNCEHISLAYNFINIYLLKNHNQIVINDVMTNNNIINYLKKLKS
jgi:TATA-box binding protein (TBP) (component of TFIID and TFIIIB)